MSGRGREMSIMISDVGSLGTDNSTIIGQGDDRIIRPPGQDTRSSAGHPNGNNGDIAGTYLENG